jgi:hypothetical protein
VRMKIKTGMALGAFAIGATVLGTTPAAAEPNPTTSWTRPCGSMYQGGFSETLAYTDKENSGCAGHAWLRVKKNGKWGEWKHASGGYTITGSGFQVAQHKGCSNCAVYQTWLNEDYLD